MVGGLQDLGMESGLEEEVSMKFCNMLESGKSIPSLAPGAVHVTNLGSLAGAGPRLESSPGISSCAETATALRSVTRLDFNILTEQ